MRILIGIIAAVACFIMVESLTCNQCTFAMSGFCLDSSQVECETNSSLCYTATTEFEAVNIGYTSQGCLESSLCNMTTNGTLLFSSYTVKTECCDEDGCNPVQLSGAPSAQATLTAVMGVAVLASMWGSVL
ncbi:uncharacterized protein ACBR49_017540 [Aulostomus maculatus]